jgi:hypothetical protein
LFCNHAKSQNSAAADDDIAGDVDDDATDGSFGVDDDASVDDYGYNGDYLDP